MKETKYIYLVKSFLNSITKVFCWTVSKRPTCTSSSMLSAESMKLDKSLKLLEALGITAQATHGKVKVIFQVLQGFAYTKQARSLCCADLQLCVE